MSEERRLVTILFADVSGSTSLGESLDPEDLRALLKRYYATASEVVSEFGGTIEKFIGDAVMAVFGLPVAHGDDASRALSAALSLRDRVRADPRLGDRLPIRLGVASGDIVARRDAAAFGDFLVTGDAVNVAARLQQAAETWSILVTERTARACREFDFGSLSYIDAKGKSRPIEARLLVGRGSESRSKSPIIGREADLAQLELVARRVFDERRPFLVSLVAPAGTGKTRLVEALLDRLPAIGPSATVAIAQCLPYGQRLTYWPLRALLQRLVGATEDLSSAEFSETLDRWLERHAVPDARSVSRALLATLGVADVEPVDRNALFAAWRTAIEAAALDGPLVLVLEDLHWSSDSLLDLLDSLVQPRVDLPILIVVVARPELLDRRSNWSSGRRNALSLALDPLRPEAVASLVSDLVPGVSTQIVQEIVARADGNPFYAFEIVRALVEQVGMPLETKASQEALMHLPDTVQATLLARLDALQPSERRFLQVGSIFGRSFHTGGIVRLEDSLAADAPAILERLIDRDLIRPSGGDDFFFRHILIREVAYGMLPRASRANLHAKASQWLVQRAGTELDAFAELVAAHAREAATLATSLDLDEANELRSEAVIRLEAAAEVARNAGAHTEAIRHLRAAIELAPTERHLDLYVRIGDTMVHGDTNVEALMRALELAQHSDAPPERVFHIIVGILTYHTRWPGSVTVRADDQKIEELFAVGRELLARVAKPLLRAQFRIAEAFLPFSRHQERKTPSDTELSAAKASAEEALRLATEMDDANLQSAALDAIQTLAGMQGDLVTALGANQRRLDLGNRLGLGERIDAACMFADCSIRLGNLQAAIDVCDTTNRLLVPGRSANWPLHLYSWRTVALALHGDWDAAIASANRAHRLWIDLDRLAAGYAIAGFFMAYEVSRGRRDDVGMTTWREIHDEISRQFGQSQRRDLGLAIVADDLESVLHLASTEEVISPSDELLERAISLLCDRRIFHSEAILHGMLKVVFPQARMLVAQINRALGLLQGNVQLLENSLEVMRRAGARPAAARLEVEIGRMAGKPDLVEAGMRTLQEIGDVHQIDLYLRWS